MKKVLAVLLVIAMVFGLAACGGNTDENGGDQTASGYDDIPDTMTSEDGTYELAFVTDIGQLKDASFNQFTWNGVKGYAYENGISYKYYQPANGNEATDADRLDAMSAAAEAGAKIVVAAGFLQGPALQEAAAAYPDTMFLFIDGWTLTDADGNPLPNVAAVVYQEEQAGYLAGYAVVMEGFTKLGFSGGGGGTNPACIRFGYGFVQGAEAAAAVKEADIEMKYSWEYGANFSASPDLQAMLNGWYQAGTEVIFECGGSMYQSAFAAASANDGWVVGVDTDQSGLSETVITSATKDLAGSVEDVCAAFYAGNWSDFGGKCVTLGAADERVGIPSDTWKFENWTVEEYNTMFEQLKAGELVVDNAEIADPSTLAWEHITFVN